DARVLWQRGSYTVLVQAARPREYPAWDGTSLPRGVRGTEENFLLARGLFFTADTSDDRLREVEDVAGLIAALHEGGYQGPVLDGPDGWSAFGLEEPPTVLLIVDRTFSPHFFMLHGEGKRRVRHLSLVRSP